jgi:hypothetical protein
MQMLSRMSVLQNSALMNPAETRRAIDQVPITELQDEVQEITNAAGFCMLIDRESGIEPDVRVQTMDDLWLSLVARARGYRITRSLATIIRHSKQPWAPDDKAPWEQEDRSRFGKDHPYYQRERHEAKRRLEAKLMIKQFGDLARITLPKELLPWADPLHPDFAMAWDCGQPIEYKTEISCLNGFSREKTDEMPARGTRTDEASFLSDQALACAEGTRGVAVYAEAQKEV